MAATYEIWIMDHIGNILDVIDDWILVRYVRALNAIGMLSLILDGNYNISFLKVDGRIVIWRNVDGKSYIDTDTAWLIRTITRRLEPNGTETIIANAVSANEILSRRIVAEDSDTGQADKSDLADDMMKEIVAECLGTSASTGRDISTYLSIESDTSQGPTVSKEFARRNVFDVLLEISETTVQAGSPVYFDIFAPTHNTLEFRTYRDLRGVDHSFPDGLNPVILSPDRGNLADIVREYNYQAEVTYVYCGGQGIGEVQEIQTASSSDRINVSVFNRREVFINATMSSGSAAVLDDTSIALRAGRPKRTFQGQLLDAPGTKYGVNWGFGDKVTAEFKGESLDCTVDGIEVFFQQGRETIRASLRVVEE